MREEITLEIVGNQKEIQRGRGLDQEDQNISSILGNQGMRRKIVGKGKVKIKLQNGNHWLLHIVPLMAFVGKKLF